MLRVAAPPEVCLERYHSLDETARQEPTAPALLKFDNRGSTLIIDAVEGSNMSGWQSRVKELLYESESVEEALNYDDTRVVVTSHRVMAFTPEMDGENFRQVERPNVTGVGTGAQSRASLAARSIRYGIYGAVLILAGYFLNFESFVGGVNFDAESAKQTGAGGIVETTQGMLDLIANLDELMQTFGALALLAAVAIFGVYWLLRTPTMVISVAGDEADIHVPRPENADEIAPKLEALILPDGAENDDLGSRLSSALPDDIL
jgi:hypothetical protein